MTNNGSAYSVFKWVFENQSRVRYEGLMKSSSDPSKPLDVIRLNKTYKRGNTTLHAAKDVSFSIDRGEIFGLLGPNGAGKTTVISMITTLVSITQGEILIFGESVAKNPQFTKRNIGIVPQELVNQGFFNLIEILGFHSGYYGVRNNREYIHYLLKRLGLWDHRNKEVKQLSGGMKRRLMIAKALVHRPKLLLLDEPTAGVDIELRSSLWEFVQELQKEGISILLTTHYLEEAEALCGRVGIIQQGRLQYLGHTQEIIKKLTRRQVELELKSPLTGTPPAGATLVSSEGLRVIFSIPSNMGVGTLFSSLGLASEQIVDIKTQEGSLEEAFLSVVNPGAGGGVA